MKLTLILIRHGQVPGNIDRRFIGSTDESLTDEGVLAIKKRAEDGEYPAVNLVFSSPMSRCTETAGIIYPELVPLVIDDLREMNFGIFENKNHAMLDGNPDYQKWLDSGGRDYFPGGEIINDFCKRVMSALEEVKHIASDYGKRNNLSDVKAALVVHGGTIMAIQSGLLLCDFYDRMFNNGDYRLIELHV